MGIVAGVEIEGWNVVEKLF